MASWISDGVKAQACITSPPYWNLRDYGVAGQIGMERTPAEYIDVMVEVFELVRMMLADSGTLWLNMGDNYATTNSYSGDGGQMAGRKHAPARAASVKCVPKGWKPKDMIGMPWRLAFALQEAGWYLRQDIIWHKPNPMPESSKDRCTKAHEYLFLLSKSRRYYFDADAIAEPVSPDTHMRAARGRSDTHKWADGGPGDHSLAKVPPNGGHARGVNPKAVAGWATGAGSHHAVDHAQSPKDAGRDDQGLRASDKFGRGPGWRSRQNPSFSAAVAGTELLVRNKRSVWTIPTQPFSGAHFATFPEALVSPCILAGTQPGQLVLDPFVALHHGRQYLGCELNPAYSTLQGQRASQLGMAM